MVIAYVIEGVVIGVFAGLLLRPVLDSYILWRHAKALAQEDVELYTFDLPSDPGEDDATDLGKRISHG